MLRDLYYLIRLDKPIGILLLLWPTLWALWLASDGVPKIDVLLIFLAGVVLMRSAGCVMNDVFDRNFDGEVTRTRLRPIAQGKISVTFAVSIAALLALAAFVLVLFCNVLTVQLAIVGAILAVTYPLLKRVTHVPQLGLGLAFSWGVPMAFAAVNNHVTSSVWMLFATAAIWPVIYDTMYAMTDRQDDLRIGVKSTAILFGDHDVFIIGLMQALFIIMMAYIGLVFELQPVFYLSLFVVSLLFTHQLYSIQARDPKKCFHAFLNNNWVGAVIFLGIAFSTWQGA